MRFDDNLYYTENTNLLEFFDSGDKPYYSVSNITSNFIDLDGNKNEIGGIITFTGPNLYEHQEYRLYAGICNECRDYLVASIKWTSPNTESPNKIVIPYDTKIFNSKYLILITANEHGENDKNVYIDLIDQVYDCTEWNQCDKLCITADYKNDPNEIGGYAACVENQNIKRECHRITCPLSKISIWPKYTNFNPEINYQIDTNRAYVSSLYHKKKPLYIYQKYSFKESKSKLKITIFNDDDDDDIDKSLCVDLLSLNKCRELVKNNECLKNPFKVLRECQLSCGACHCKWDLIEIASYSISDTLDTDIVINSIPITKDIYVREMFIRSDTGYIDDNYLVSIKSIVKNIIKITITSVISKYGWNNKLSLIYVIDTIKPIHREIEYDETVVNNIIYQRYKNDLIQYTSMIPINDINDDVVLIKVEIISYFDNSFEGCNTTAINQSRYDIFACPTISNIIFITIIKQVQTYALHKLNKECLFFYVEYDEYDKWLTQSFEPEFDAINNFFYTVLDENPTNKFGEIHINIACYSNLTWFIQIGIEDNWRKWLTGGFNKVANSDRFLTNEINEKTGNEFIQELRRLKLKMNDIDKFVPKDEKIANILNISIKIEKYDVDGLLYSDQFVLTCIRLADFSTETPMLIKPEYGDIVPSGFLISYLIKEDAYKDTLELIIKPRESIKYKTDDNGERIITLNENTFIGKANIIHSIKFCPRLEKCMKTEMKTIIKFIKPTAVNNLIEFSLYDFTLRYKDKWNNPYSSHTINDVMIVRDWSEDLYVLRTIYDKLNGKNWFVKWDIDNSNNYCDNEWYGIKCNSLKQLVSINLFSNNLYGELPLEIGKLSSLQYLDLSSNYITGTIPITIQLLTICKYISFSSNSLIGSIPNGLENMNNLNILNLAGNMLSGTITNGLLLSAKESNLKNIYLNGNRLTGYIPNKFKDIKDLNILYLSDNDWYCPSIDYSKWAKHTDYTSINKCIQPPKSALQSDIKTPIEII